MNLSGVILAGGKSVRFGSDKALHVHNGLPLIAHAANGFKNFNESFVVGGNAARYDFLGLPVYADQENFSGSLYGIVRALEIASCARVAITACDMPNLTPAYWDWLASFNASVVIPENEHGFAEPLAAMYAKELLPLAQAAFLEKQLKLSSWFLKADVLYIPWSEIFLRFGEQVFLNANTLLDLHTSPDLEI